MNKIKEARKAKNLSQKELATMLGVTPQAISLYEKGKRKISDGFYHQLANVLDTDIYYLRGDTYSKKELLTMFNNSYLNKYSFLRPKIIYYLDFIGVDKPEQLFTAEQLKELTDSVKEYWLKYFGFIFDANYKKDANFNDAIYKDNKDDTSLSSNTIVLDTPLLPPDSLVIDFITKIYDEISKRDASLINKRFNKEVKTAIRQYLDKADLITTYGTKKQVLEFNNKLVDTINSFSKSLEGLPDNPNIDAEKVEKYLD